MKSILYVFISLCLLCSCDAGIHPLSKSNLEESSASLLQTQSDKNTVSSDFEILQIDFSGNETANTVASNIGLPTTGSYGSTIEWESNSNYINASNGKVTRPDASLGNRPVLLTANIQKGDASKKKKFNLTVLSRTLTGDDDDDDD